jgi:large subunit ribosomal protein L1
MNVVGCFGKILGFCGLMLNLKVGIVTMDVVNVVKDIKAGQVEFRVDKQGNLHAPVGRISFNVDQLAENIRSFVDSVQRLKPSTSKGVYMRQCCISSTMGPGLRVSL